MTDIVVITGLSGAGRSQVADDMEDLGWFVVDNLPTSLIEKVTELAAQPGSSIQHLALVVGRVTGQQSEMVEVVQRLRASGDRVRIVFLEASDAELVKRYGATKRKHPLATADGSVLDAVQQDRAVFEPLRAAADLVIDTTGKTIYQLKAQVTELFSDEIDNVGMQTSVVSFGFKHGVPVDVDLLFDVRFLPNPFWVDTLRDQSGLDPDVRAYVLGNELSEKFLNHLDGLFELLLPAYVEEGKSYLTIAIGCTGGRHRSVALSEELGHRLRAHGTQVRVQHRDIGRHAAV
jgi:RNase adapter protein RapZ